MARLRRDGQNQRVIAQLGGAAAHARGVARRFTAAEARAAGRKGGQAASQDREHMTDMDRMGSRSRGRRADKKHGRPRRS